MKLLPVIVLLLTPFTVLSQDLPAGRYKIYNTATQKTVTIDAVADDMAGNDVLFFGEEHDDSAAHDIEYALFKKLTEKYQQKTALSMEMFQTDCQLVLNEYLAGLILEKNLISDARTWPNYDDYRPLIELAKLKRLQVIAANAPTRYTNLVTRRGLTALNQLDAQGKSYLPPLPIDTVAGTYYDKFAQIMGGHAEMPGMQLYQSQNLWDATMGWSIASFCKNHPGYKVLQLNGGFHSEEKLGAVAQLKKYTPGLRVLNIAAYTDENFDKPDWNKYKQMADYLILTDPKPSKTF